MSVTLRRGVSDDAEICGTLCFEAFQTIAEAHHFPADFPSPGMAIELLAILLEREDVYSVVAQQNGQILGSNFLWEGDFIAGVGPITVDPGVQNQAVGRRLMSNVLEYAMERRFAGVRLVQAAYHNRSLSLYTKLGFETREPLSTLQGQPLQLSLPGRRVRVASEADLEPCNALCTRIHGHDRGHELAIATHQGSATVVEHAGQISGYATAIGFFGHAVGESNEDLKALIGAAPAFIGPGFLLPTRNGELLRWCLAKGLRIVQPMTLMSRGFYQEPVGAFLPSILY